MLLPTLSLPLSLSTLLGMLEDRSMELSERKHQEPKAQLYKFLQNCGPFLNERGYPY